MGTILGPGSFSYAELHATFPPIVGELLELPRWACMKSSNISSYKTHSTIVLNTSDAFAAALAFFIVDSTIPNPHLFGMIEEGSAPLGKDEARILVRDHSLF